MASKNAAAVSAFIEGAPPGELADVVTDIKALTEDDPTLLEKARPAFQKYNEEQLTTVKLPGERAESDGLGTPGPDQLLQFARGGQILRRREPELLHVRSRSTGASNALSWASGWAEADCEGRKRRTCSPTRSNPNMEISCASTGRAPGLEQSNTSTQTLTLSFLPPPSSSSLSKTLTTHAHEHYPSSTCAVVPVAATTASIAILLVSNKYSPSNFWNGRLRTTYLYHPATTALTGTLRCDVHYYEDGNVRLLTTKTLPPTTISPSASEIMKTIAKVEKGWQEELNRGFSRLSEGEFKNLRRQLPVTRQKVEWEKVTSYRAGKEIGGGRR
ncbi:MAG: F-actin-capping protein subunit alpha [Alectoria sarmentosa]|nr:MAG: F-actin-capping protein subunit alpha [Alectoria sarmentosa]